tara:strand:- start:1265 stop:1465 length:201 start_codon:yes stop_codon:yes gene_type:complete
MSSLFENCVLQQKGYLNFDQKLQTKHHIYRQGRQKSEQELTHQVEHLVFLSLRLAGDLNYQYFGYY